MNNLIWIEINKKALAHNIKIIRKLVGEDTIVAPAVKSNAYGHGLAEVSKEILKAGADWLSVNSIDEAAILRLNKIKAPIMVLGYIPQDELAGVIKLNVKPLIYSLEVAKKLNDLATSHPTSPKGLRGARKVKCHIKVDTGMGRQGVLAGDAIDFIKEVQKLENLEIEGLATHYASSDEPEAPQVFKKQRERFMALVENLGKADIFIPYIHSANSAVVLLHGNRLGNLVRPGKSIYGNYPSKSVGRICVKKGLILKPALTFKTKVAHVKVVPKGTSISYGSTFTTKKKTTIAVLPVGYYDGYDRKLSNTGEVLIKGKRCKILGRVCMNICMADITKIKNVRVEDEVVLIGKQGKEQITVEEVADKVGTINYEVVTRLRESIPRYFI
jgi:alanine racemase